MIVRSLKRLTPQMASFERSMSTVPLHLARANNGMVNVLVKSTKVPRPATIVPAKKSKQNNETLTPCSTVQREAMPSHISYVGNEKMPITSNLKIVTPKDDTPRGIWPVFRMMVSFDLQLKSLVYC